MNKNSTALIFLLDRSGSMASLVKDTIGGFNAFLDKQKVEPGKVLLTTVLFDGDYEVLHDGINLLRIPHLTEKEYFVRGRTALLDAMGKAINTVGAQFAAMKEADRPSKVLFVVTTDGEENSSHEFTASQIKEMVTLQTNAYKWQFIFLGANIDSFSVASSIGIHLSANYTANDVGTRSVYATMSDVAAQYRASTDNTIPADWNKDIK